MKLNRWKDHIVNSLMKFIKSDEYKYLRIIYLIAIVSSIVVYWLGPSAIGGDTGSYYLTKKIILGHSLDHIRPPLYPVFLIITQSDSIAIFFQYFIFFISIAYFFQFLRIIKLSPRMVFVTMLVYVCHPIIMYYHNQVIPESICISLSSIFIYYLAKYINSKRILYCWIFHIIMVFLIFLKPVFIFLLAISVILFFYLFFKRNAKIILTYILPFLFVCITVGGYGLTIKRIYGVYSISSVSDVNLYWMLRTHNQINTDLVKNEDVKNFVLSKVDIKHDHFAQYFFEAVAIVDQYGWKELHDVVQSSIKKNYKAIIFNDSNLKEIKKNMDAPVGESLDYFSPQSENFYYFNKIFPYLNFYQLIFILLFYLILIIRNIYKSRSFPIISVLLWSYVTIHLISLFLTAPNNYGRLIVPSLAVIVIICMQCLNWFTLFICKKEKQFELV